MNAREKSLKALKLKRELENLELKKVHARSEYRCTLQKIEDEQERILCELRALEKEGKR